MKDCFPYRQGVLAPLPFFGCRSAAETTPPKPKNWLSPKLYSHPATALRNRVSSLFSFVSIFIFVLSSVCSYLRVSEKGREKEPPFSSPAIKRQEKEKKHETHKEWFRRGTLSRSKPVRRPCSSSHQIQGSPEPSPPKNLFQMTSPACHSASRLKERLCKSS